MDVLIIAVLLLPLGGCSALRNWVASTTAVRHPLDPSAQDVPRSLPGDDAVAPAPATYSDVSSSASMDTKKVSATPVRRTVVNDAPVGLASEQIGYYMDVLQGRLTQDIGREAHIQRRGNRIIILLPPSFESDTAQITASGRDVLRRVAAILVEYRFTIVEMQMRGPDPDPGADGLRLASDRMVVLSRCLTDAGVAGRRIESSAQAPNLVPGAAGPTVNAVDVQLQLTPIGGPL